MVKGFNNLSELAAQPYSAFIVDLWGVLHDGGRPYGGAVEGLKKLHAAGKKILLLSNAPRRAKMAEDKLTNMGFPRDCYDAILTSGEATYNFLSGDEVYGKSYYYIGPERDKSLLEGLPYMRVDAPGDADFTVTTGYENDSSTRVEKLPEMKECIAKGIPLLCANPDMVVVRHDGTKPLCAGVMAEIYEDLGGNVQSFGKPYDYVYSKSMELLGIDDKSAIAAIGDNLHTDILGANNNGIYSVLVTGGILAGELGINHGSLPTEEALNNVCRAEGIFPDAVIPAFIW